MGGMFASAKKQNEPMNNNLQKPVVPVPKLILPVPAILPVPKTPKPVATSSRVQRKFFQVAPLSAAQPGKNKVGRNVDSTGWHYGGYMSGMYGDSGGNSSSDGNRDGNGYGGDSGHGHGGGYSSYGHVDHGSSAASSSYGGDGGASSSCGGGGGASSSCGGDGGGGSFS